MAKHGSQKVAHHFSAHFRLVKTPSIAIWGNIFVFGGWGGVGGGGMGGVFPRFTNRSPAIGDETEKLDFLPKTNMLPHMAIEGVLARRKCAAKWCATFWTPRSPNLVSLNSKICNFPDLVNF